MILFSRRRFVAILAAASLAAPLATAPVLANDNEPARTLVMDTAARLVALIQSDASRAQKESKFLSLMEETSEMSAIARTALGAPWRSMSSAQQERYDIAFRNYLAKNYVARFRDYTGEQLSYVRTTETQKGVYVETQVARQGGDAFEVVWRLKDFGGALKIVDIKAASLSLLATEREILTNLLDSKGGDFDAFISTLEGA
ncbi:MAG: ABC transporter substrate-binding protein [Rhodobacteraceae bacterium]|nr:ABC transporter substrate-binding protein [Paracoccaceae bacterium]